MVILKRGNVALGPGVKNIYSYTRDDRGDQDCVRVLVSHKKYKCWAKEVTECCLSTEENQIYLPSKMSPSFHLRNVGLEAEV